MKSYFYLHTMQQYLPNSDFLNYYQIRSHKIMFNNREILATYLFSCFSLKRKYVCIILTAFYHVPEISIESSEL